MTHNTKNGAASNYGELLRAYQPRVIDSDREHTRATKKIEALMRLRKRSAAEDKLLNLLVALVEPYDVDHFPLEPSSPREILTFLLEQRGISQAQFARDIEVSRQLVTEILAGRTAISAANVRRFADYFGADVELFVPSSVVTI